VVRRVLSGDHRRRQPPGRDITCDSIVVIIIVVMPFMVSAMRIMMVMMVTIVTIVVVTVVRRRVVIDRLIDGNGLHEHRSRERQRRAETEAERQIAVIGAARLWKRCTRDQAAEQKASRGGSSYAHNRTFH